MSLTEEIKGIWSYNWQVAFRPSQVYSSVTGAYNLFEVLDGPILALEMIGMHTAASGGATTLAVTVSGGIGMDAGAVAINGAVGTVVAVGMNVACVQAGAAVALPLTTALFHNPQGAAIGLQAALAPTFVIGTFAVSTVTMTWALVYRQLSPLSRVIVP
jgi:hypothetical protein